MNGWTFAGWAFAALATLMLLNKTRTHQDQVNSLTEEREALWEQMTAWKPLVEAYALEHEERARQAAIN